MQYGFSENGCFVLFMNQLSTFIAIQNYPKISVVNT